MAEMAKLVRARGREDRGFMGEFTGVVTPYRSRSPTSRLIGGKKTKKLKIYKTKAHNIKVSNKTKNKKNKKKIILNKTLKTNIRNNSKKKRI